MKDKVEPIVYLGLDEGAGVDDIHIVGLLHHQSLDVPLRYPYLLIVKNEIDCIINFYHLS